MMFWLLVGTTWAGWEPTTKKGVDAYNKGVDQLAAGKSKKAASAFEQALEREPDCGMCAAALGQALYFENRSDEAYRVLLAVAEEHGEQDGVYLWLSQAAFAAERFEDAQNAATAALAVAPNDFDAAWNLLGTVLRTGQIEVGENYLASWSDVHPAQDLACLEVELALEIDDLPRAEAALPACRTSQNPDLVAEAEGWYAGRVADADLFDATSQAMGIDVTPSFRATALFNEGRYDEALAVMADYEIPPGPAGVPDHVLVALIHFEKGDDERARDGLAVVFEGDTWVQVERSGAVTGILTKSAEEIYLRGLQDAAALKVRLHVRAGELADAQATQTRMTNTLGDSASLAAAHVELLVAQGDVSTARNRLDGAFEKWPDDATLRQVAGVLVVERPELVSDGVRAALASASWQGAYNMAIDASNGERWAECDQLLDGLEVDPEYRLDAADMQLGCVLSGGDLDRALALHRAQAHSEEMIWALAGSLIDAGRDADAEAVVADLPEGSLARLNTLLLVAVNADRTDQALALVEAGADAPLGLANLGVLLANEGRYDEARRYVKLGCKDLQDQAWCMETLDSLKGAK